MNDKLDNIQPIMGLVGNLVGLVKFNIEGDISTPIGDAKYTFRWNDSTTSNENTDNQKSISQSKQLTIKN
jgi:hypothetical protein